MTTKTKIQATVFFLSIVLSGIMADAGLAHTASACICVAFLSFWWIIFD